MRLWRRRYGRIGAGMKRQSLRSWRSRPAGGRALELAIGTGRIALPLAAQGISVDGVDIAPAMVAELRAQAGGEGLAVTLGDFADVPVEGTYSLVYIVGNTFFNLLTQEEQVRCFGNVAAHLGDGGVFVIETYVPAFLYRLQNNQYVEAESVEVDAVRLDVLRHDPVTQVIEESHITLSAAGMRFNPVVHSYALLTEKQRTLFRRLGVFAGAFALPELEEVSRDSPEGGTYGGSPQIRLATLRESFLRCMHSSAKASHAPRRCPLANSVFCCSRPFVSLRWSSCGQRARKLHAPAPLCHLLAPLPHRR